jgi:hypothetical protein
MSPDAGQAWFRLGFFITIVSLVILPFQRRDSAEFVVATISLVIGLLIIGIIVLIIKLSR